MEIIKEKYFSSSHRFGYFLISGGMFAFTGWLFYKSFAAVFVMPVLSLAFYKKYKAYVIKSKKESVNMNFKDVLYAFLDSAASGKQADTAIFNSYRNLKNIYGEDNILTREFKYMSAGIRESRDSPDRLLMEFGSRMDIEDIRNFMEIYCICIRSGGEKEKAISRSAGIIGEKIMIRQELSGILISKKIEACILCVIPIAVLGFMQIFSADYSSVLYTSIQGRIIMTLCLGAALWAVALCMRIMDIKI
ncbi:MAG: type II secretion system F family protein [Firmicutes bacterium]|nr:type II secretion system F family protein [Bacillota bacterium]